MTKTKITGLEHTTVQVLPAKIGVRDGSYMVYSSKHEQNM